jgi:1-acyl-sn-glycerol-3-phosphate acyltransferase
MVIFESAICKWFKLRFRFITLQCWGNVVLFVLGIFVFRNKAKLPPPYLIMPNHRSYIDIFIVAAYAPASFVAKAELKKWPIIGWAATSAKIIMVKRDELRSLMATMNKIKDNFRNKLSVVVFPEGTTFKGPGLKPFKNGTFKIASDLEINIIPCAISYRNKNLAWTGNDSFLAHFFREMWRPYARAYLRFGEALISSDYKYLKDTSQNSILSMLSDTEK